MSSLSLGGAPCSVPALTTAPQQPPAQKPFRGRWGHACPQRHTVKVSEIENGGLLPSAQGEVRAISCLSPRVRISPNCWGLYHNCNLANSTCVPRPARSQRESKSESLQQPVQINRDNS